MRVSYMCHLPALAWNNKIQGIAAEIGRFGLVMHSVYSDGNKSAGDIYQISNQITLGVTEKELIENITNIVQQIVTQERILRNRLKRKTKDFRAGRHLPFLRHFKICKEGIIKRRACTAFTVTARSGGGACKNAG